MHLGVCVTFIEVMCESLCVCVSFILLECVDVYVSFSGVEGSFICVGCGYIAFSESFKVERLRVSVESVCIEFGLCVIGDSGMHNCGSV